MSDLQFSQTKFVDLGQEGNGKACGFCETFYIFGMLLCKGEKNMEENH